MLPDVTETLTTEMTSFELVEPTQAPVTPDVLGVQAENGTNRTRFQIAQLFAREYQLVDKTFTPATIGTTTINPYQHLAEGVLGEYATLFAFVRWKNVKVRILCKSNPLQYGSIFFTYMPYYNGAGGPFPYYDTDSYASYDPVILDITSQQEVEINIPWHSPLKFLLAGNDTVNTAGSMMQGYIQCYQLLAIESTDSEALAAPVLIQTFASYEGIEFYGPRDENAETKIKRLQSKIAALSVQQAERKTKKYRGQAETFAQHASNLFQKGLNAAAEHIGEKITKQAVGDFADAAMNWWNGASGVTPESATRETKFEPFNNDCSLATAPPPSKSLGDCHVSTPEPIDSQIKHSFLDLIMKPYLVSYGIISGDPGLVDHWIVHPRFQGLTDWLATPQNPNPTLLWSFMTKGYLGYMSTFFSQWRGAMKFKIYFFTNSFTSGRVRITTQFGPQDSGDSSVYTGNIPAIFVDIKGSTSVEFSVPYLSLPDWSPLDINSQLPEIDIYLDSALSSNGDLPPAIQYIVYGAADSDMQFRNLNGTGQCDPYVAPTKTYSGQMRPWNDFKSSFKRITSGLDDIDQTSSDQPRFVEDLLSRWSYGMTNAAGSIEWSVGLSPVDAFSQFDYYYPRVTNPYLAYLQGFTTLFDAVGLLYLFNTGSVDWKISIASNWTPSADKICVGKYSSQYMRSVASGHTDKVRYKPDPDVPDTGNVVIDPLQWKVLDISTPFIADVPWDTWMSSTYYTSWFVNDCQEYGQSWEVAPQTIWKRAGHDFLMTLLLPLPTQNFWPAIIYRKATPPSTIAQETKNKNISLLPNSKRVERANLLRKEVPNDSETTTSTEVMKNRPRKATVC